MKRKFPVILFLGFLICILGPILFQEKDKLDLNSAVPADPMRELKVMDSMMTSPAASGFSINRLSKPAFYEKKSFVTGEHLNFKIRYGFVKAGEAEMKVLGEEELKQRKVYHIQTKARSISTFEWIYKVRDEVNSFIDFYGLYPLRFEKKLREGNYKSDLYVDYFHEDSTAQVEFIRYKKNMEIRNRRSSLIKIPPYVNDILSAFYLVRNQNIEVGKPIYLTTNEKEKVYDLQVVVHAKEIIEVEAGKFNCFQIEPVLQGEGIFKQEGRLKIWLSEDEYKIPVQMTSEVVIGHITTELVEIKGIKLPLPSQIK